MKTFLYTAKSEPQKLISGEVKAADYDSVIRKISDLGLIPVEIKQQKEIKKSADIGKFKNLYQKEVLLFTRQLSDLLASSIPLTNALTLVINQTKQSAFRKVLLQINKGVMDGESLSTMVKKFPEVFSPIYANLVEAGEFIGSLDVIFSQIADYLEKRNDMKQRLWLNLSYPLFVLVIGFLAVIVLITFVVPRITGMFQDMGQNLPVPTQIFLSMSAGINKYGWLVAFVIFVGIAFWKQWIKSDKNRLLIDQQVLRLPGLSSFYFSTEMYWFFQTWSLLIKNWISVEDGLNLAQETINNSFLHEEIRQAHIKIQNGSKVSSAFNSISCIPQLVKQILSVNETSGNFGRGLDRLAVIYEQQTERTAKTVLAVLGPAVLTIIVMIVGLIVTAVLLPIWQVNLSIQ